MNRIHALDGLRGVAAITVVFYHLTQVRLFPSLFPHGYLAVDFFFILSGFVVARAYEERITAGLSMRRFLTIRAVRLMPLSTLGALAGLLVLLAKWVWYPDKVDELWRIVVSGLLNLALLPTPFGGAVSRHELFPGNGPLWSLFFEVVANVLWAAVLVRLTTKFTAALAAIGGVCFAVAVVYLGHANFGWDQGTSWFGGLRVVVGFLSGVVIHRWLPVGVVVRGKFTTVALALGLGAILAVPVHSSLYDVLCILVVFPVLVAFSGLVVVTNSAQRRLWAALGDLSYPLYVLHFPMLLVASAAAQVAGSKVAPVAVGFAALVASVIGGWLALRVYDEPVRAKLASILRGETRRAGRVPVTRPAHQRSGSFLISPPPGSNAGPRDVAPSEGSDRSAKVAGRKTRRW